MKVLGVAVGGALGAVLRWWLGDLFPGGSGYPWTTFVINVTGSAVLAALPAFAVVRRNPGLAAALGPGVLGGYTTLSAYSVQVRQLLADGRGWTAGAYLVGTLAACLLAITLVDLLSTRVEQDVFEAEAGDE